MVTELFCLIGAVDEIMAETDRDTDNDDSHCDKAWFWSLLTAGSNRP